MLAQMITQLFLLFLAHFWVEIVCAKFRPLLIWANMLKIDPRWIFEILKFQNFEIFEGRF